jgi:hypothetical protein
MKRHDITRSAHPKLSVCNYEITSTKFETMNDLMHLTHA